MSEHAQIYLSSNPGPRVQLSCTDDEISILANLINVMVLIREQRLTTAQLAMIAAVHNAKQLDDKQLEGFARTVEYAFKSLMEKV